MDYKQLSKIADSSATMYSSNKKLNAVLNEIEDELLSIHDTEEESKEEIEHYMHSFPREVDYNLAQYGNLLVSYAHVRDMYKECGYSDKTIDKMSDDRIWETYKRQVGYVAREIMKH